MIFPSRLRRRPALVMAALASMLFSVLAATPAAAQGYFKLNLVSSTPKMAIRTDPNLVVPWGIVANPQSPWWIANNGSGTSTLYDGFGKIIPLVVTISPAAGGTPPSVPTGVVANTSADFVVSNGLASGPSLFIFATLDGTIQGWSPAASFTNSIIGLDNSSHGAAYTGLAIGSNAHGNFLFAANFAQGTVDVIDKTFHHISSFTDPSVPMFFAPFGIQNINGNLYVTFAPQAFVVGAGQGFVDVFDTTGLLITRLISKGPLNLPWGIALSPGDFGAFSNALLVGNLGDGTINAFDFATNKYLGPLPDRHGNPISIPFLWGIAFGNDQAAGKANVLYFASGAGIFGSLYPRGVRPK